MVDECGSVWIMFDVLGVMNKEKMVCGCLVRVDEKVCFFKDNVKGCK